MSVCASDNGVSLTIDLDLNSEIAWSKIRSCESSSFVIYKSAAFEVDL